MLLNHTTCDIKPREALTVNPAKTCQPIGAMYAGLGVHRCLPHSHGSQGCASYHRSALSRHFREPAMAATSSFTEGASVFGGQANLLTAIQNIFEIYEPDVIAVHTTCLSETIGDDIPQIVAKAKDEGKIPDGKYVFHANTPSYVGAHITGYSNMTKAMVDYFSESTLRAKVPARINLIPSWADPGDVREMKRIAAEMRLDAITFPDVTDVFDVPQTGHYEMYPAGGVTIDRLKLSGDSSYSVALGAVGASAAADALEAKCRVPARHLEMPFGLRATDKFVDALRHMNGGYVSPTLLAERGRLLDVITDMHQYFHGKQVAIFGDPDPLVPLTEFLIDLDMIPKYVITTSPVGKRWEERMAKALEPLGKAAAKTIYKQGPGADLYHLHQLIKNERPDLLIGNTYGKYIARDEDLPFVRFGFPVVDRIGHNYFPVVGYMGAMRLLEKFLNVFLDRIDRDAPESRFELVL